MLHRHDFALFVGEMLIDLGSVFVGEFLEFFLRVLLVVLGDTAVMGVLFELVHRVPPDVANGHAPILGHFSDNLNKLLATFLAQFWKEKAYGTALNGRGEAEIALEDGL